MATFKAKARAVELLGKGQIADLPTAITELWKNGYDAYAKNLSCKLFLDSYKDNDSPLFILEDDGVGMSEDDILNRWFVLGTDSKARGKGTNPEFGLKKRIPMGEKGIGRLSVSYLGNQMLMLSKKDGELANAMLMDWRILDNYDFFLEDLNIPLFQFDSKESFLEQFKNAKEIFKGNLKEDNWKEQIKLHKEISSDLDKIIFANFLTEELISKFADNNYHGTSFLIFTPHDQLLELSTKDRSEKKEDNSLTYLRASLSGLHNDLKNPDKDFQTSFKIYDAAGKYDLLDAFFTREEMQHFDHWLQGEFDETGFFSGEIRVFNKREKYTFRPNRPSGKTAYGSFKIEWGALEGNISSSILKEEAFKIVNNKLATFGGLYIYRDDFRVLPYGRTDVDFLEFEKRRTLGAAYYFFSHRRFIGYIDISREKNSALKDKAGREGFIQNNAYREFRNDLIEFFIDIAKRYFRNQENDGEKTLRSDQIEEINQKYNGQIEAAKKKNKKTKKAFLEDLKDYDLGIDELNQDIGKLRESLEESVSYDEIDYNHYHNLLGALDDKREFFRDLKLTKPKGIAITERQDKQYDQYQQKYRLVDDNIRACLAITESTRERINTENLRLELNEKFRGQIRFLEKQFETYQVLASESFGRINKALKEEKDIQIESFKIQAEPYQIKDSDTKEDLSEKIKGLEIQIEEQKNTLDDSFGGFVKHISNLQIDVDDDFLRGWYQEQNEKLNEKLQDYEELAQLGMTIEIIDHQFNVLYSQMNDSINEIDQFARKNEDLEYSFRQLKTAFQHLENNHKLLKPLYRTTRRSRETISGREIEQYIRSFYKTEFDRYKIKFTVNNDFRDFEFFTYDSIIKPIFLNLINNANYWLIPVKSREIRIEYTDNEIRIMNSGEKIDEAYLDDIFTLFFTRKRDGRGIGLHLAKKHLQSIGYDIYATNDKEKNKLNGACFIISKD